MNDDVIPTKRKHSSLSYALSISRRPFQRRKSCVSEDNAYSGALDRRSNFVVREAEYTKWRKNWRNEDEYMPLLKESNEVIAWEFLRRSSIYQKVCDDIEGYMNIYPIKLSNILIDEDDAAILRRVLNNSTSWFETQFGINTFSPYYEQKLPNFLNVKIAQSYWLKEGDNEWANQTFLFDTNYASYCDGLLIAHINLRLKISDQIKTLEKEIADIKKLRRISVGNFGKKKGRKGLISYLRLLDAVAAHASKDEMLSIVGEKADNGKYTALNRWTKRAREMSEHGYKALIVSH